MMNVWSWLADAALALLLAATLITSVRLDRALRVVRRDRAAFEALITNLGAATGSVKSGIQALRNEAERAAEQIERRSGEADKMATDLSFLIEAADRAGARLERALPAAPAAEAGPAAEPAPRAVLPARIRPGLTAKAAAPKRSRAKPAPTPTPAPADLPQAMEPASAPATAPSMAPVRPARAEAADAPDAALADMRELAGITTRRRSPRAEAATGGAVIKLVG